MAKILIVEDDELVRQTMRHLLEGAGHIVEEACDGSSGLDAAIRVQPDLVLTDILMPSQDGIELILQLRRQQPEMRIVAISGGGKFGSSMFLDVARALGADDYLSKPFGKRDLLDKVQSALGENLLPFGDARSGVRQGRRV